MGEDPPDPLQGHQWVIIPGVGAAGHVLGTMGTQNGAALPCPGSVLSPLADLQEPPWVEVLVEILLALLAQPSHLIRQVARSVFTHICAHLTPRALQLILDVSWGFGEMSSARCCLSRASYQPTSSL